MEITAKAEDVDASNPWLSTRSTTILLESSAAPMKLIWTEAALSDERPLRELQIYFDSEDVEVAGWVYVAGFGKAFPTPEVHFDNSNLDHDAETNTYLSFKVSTDLGLNLPKGSGFPSEVWFRPRPERKQIVVNMVLSESDTGVAHEINALLSVADATLDLDGDGEVRALTDGLMVLRHLFGFSEDRVVSQAVSDHASRTSPSEIVDEIFKLSTLLDIDEDDTLGALTDGLVIIRYLFGYSGETLIKGAIAGEGRRRTASAVTGKLDALTQLHKMNGAQKDSDGDGLVDAADPDLDGDSLLNGDDPFPRFYSGGPDADFDGVPNESDSDDDGDDVDDSIDEFPMNPGEWADHDGDGLGDNEDQDDDNDGVADSLDIDPLGDGVFPFLEGIYGDWRMMPEQCSVTGSEGHGENGLKFGTLEKFWIRAFSFDTYLWYDELVDVDPRGSESIEGYFQRMKTLAVTESGRKKDRFHFSYDTQAWLDLINAGVAPGYGMEFYRVRSSSPRKWVVAYTEPDSPAFRADISRGQELLEVDGVNFISGTEVATLNAGLFPKAVGETHQLKFRDQHTGQESVIVLVSEEVQSTPVQKARVIQAGDSNIGYLLFNDHTAAAELLLVETMQSFAAQAVDELVVDLRYNGGGYLDIARLLASMIAGPGEEGKIFANLRFNDQHQELNPITGRSLAPINFIGQTLGFDGPAGLAIPRLGLKRVFVLSGQATCSASEALINGLLGVGLEVVLIGDQTCGKPYGFYGLDHCGTTYFTIQFESTNALGFGGYGDGFSPQGMPGGAKTLPGCSVRDDLMHSLGDVEEARLSAAIEFIETGQCGDAPGAGLSMQPPQDLGVLKPLQGIFLRSH